MVLQLDYQSAHVPSMSLNVLLFLAFLGAFFLFTSPFILALSSNHPAFPILSLCRTENA